LFGKAIYAYNFKSHKPLYFRIGDNRFENDLKPYFRNLRDQFSDIELFAYNSCKGRILDVGRGTCNYHFLMNGDITGVDNSKYIVNVARNMGAKCINANIFTYVPSKKFDTISFFGNNLGLGGTIKKTTTLLIKLKDLLNDKGSIIALQKEIMPDYVFLPIYIKYNGLQQKIKWMSFNSSYIASLGNTVGLKSKILFRDKDNYVIEFYKSLKR